MNDLEKEQTDFNEHLRIYGSKKNRYFATTYRAIGSSIGTIIVAVIIIALIFGGREIFSLLN